MTEKQYLVRYESFSNRIRFPAKVGANIIPYFSAAMYLSHKKRTTEPLLLDFSAVERPYSNGMLAVIAAVHKWRTAGRVINIVLPRDKQVRYLFRSSNWAHYLDPFYDKSESRHSRHLVTRQFASFQEVPVLVNDFMDVVLRSIRIPKDIVSALEWSLNEICDNVINHSDSIVGGFAQAITYPGKNLIAFTVADAGKGILRSLREGIPTLATDAQAIGEAIKAGVTRNREFGQGNGLAGSMRIATMTGGCLDITSGGARFYATADSSRTTEGDYLQRFTGTCVSGQINICSSFSISQALEFDGTEYVPLNIIDMSYEMESQDALLIFMKHETTGVGTRSAGRQMKNKALNLVASRPGYPIYIDWGGIPVISSSFADEFIGKLFVELGPMQFAATIRHKSMETLVRQLLDKAVLQRAAL